MHEELKETVSSWHRLLLYIVSELCAAILLCSSKPTTWKPKKGPFKTTGLLKGGYMGFHVSLGECTHAASELQLAPLQARRGLEDGHPRESGYCAHACRSLDQDIGIMEKKMEITGMIGVIEGL